MTNLKEIVGLLIMQHDCVIIPSLGGFVTNYVSAKKDGKNGIFSPPSKALNFNKSLISNDGLLIQYLAKEKNISYQEAQEIVTQEVQQIKSDLTQEKRVHFENVGFLYMNNSGKITFEQERFFNLLLSSYGLESVRFIVEEQTQTFEEGKDVQVDFKVEKIQKTILPSDKEEAKIVVLQPNSTSKKQPKKILRSLVKYAAAVAILPVLFYSFWIPLKTDVLHSKILYLDDFNPFKTEGDTKYSPEKKSQETLSPDFVSPENNLEKITENLNSPALFSYPIDEDLFVYSTISSTPKGQIMEQTENRPLPTENYLLENTNKYHAIVGCFAEFKNAQNLIEELKSKGFSAYQVDKNKGLYRVSAGNAQNLSEMENLRNQLAGAAFNSWVLKK